MRRQHISFLFILVKGDKLFLNRLVDELMDGRMTEDRLAEEEQMKEESVIDSTTPVKPPVKRMKGKDRMPGTTLGLAVYRLIVQQCRLSYCSSDRLDYSGQVVCIIFVSIVLWHLVFIAKYESLNYLCQVYYCSVPNYFLY